MGLSSFLYRSLIDPLLNSSHQDASGFISDSDSVLDVACGSGALAFMAGKKARIVTAIDIDNDMLQSARIISENRGAGNIDFIYMDATDLSSFRSNEFSISIISMAIHQFTPEEGLEVLKGMKRVSEKVVVVDYAFPQERNFYSRFTWFIEWLAGGDHYLNFRKYMAGGGIDPILGNAGLEIKERHLRGGGTIFITLCY